jgi:predicted metal-dependent enzyme (double-stranded beta helix superfamily)
MTTTIDPVTVPGMRRAAVLDLIARVRDIARDGVDRAKLEDIKAELLLLAQRKELFPVSEFASISPGSSALCRLYDGPDHQYALYVASPEPGRSNAPHDHTTWAVIAGVRGREHNRLYRRVTPSQDGPHATIEQVGEFDVVPGTALAMMPDDIHSIHMDIDGPHINLHLYGISIEHTHARTAYDLQTGETRNFPAASGVKLACGAV